MLNFHSDYPILECLPHLIEGSVIYKLLWYLISLDMVSIDHSSLSWWLLWRKTILPYNFKSLQFVFMVKAESGTICVKLLASVSNFLNCWQNSWRLGMYIALLKPDGNVRRGTKNIQVQQIISQKCAIADDTKSLL